MGIFDSFFGKTSESTPLKNEIIKTGRQKNTGGHDHRQNKGDDRTPAQKNGDKIRKK